jgi:hypothetical protein
MRRLTNLELLLFGVDVVAMAAMAIWLEPWVGDGQRLGQWFLLFMVFHMTLFLLAERFKGKAPRRLDAEVSDRAGLVVFNAGIGVWLFVLALAIVPLLIGSLRMPALAALQFTIAVAGIVAGSYYRRACKVASIAPYGVSMALALALMWIVLHAFDWGIVLPRMYPPS